MTIHWIHFILLIVALPITAADANPLRTVTIWNEERAAHLLRRAGFGGTPEEIRRLTDLGAKAAVDWLVDYEKIPQTHPDYTPLDIPQERYLRTHLAGVASSPEVDRRIVFERFQQVYRQLHLLQMLNVRAWWIQRMILTPRPLEEKMTLFWHGHFTSGAREVHESNWMVDQHEFLRSHALGNLRDLLIGISQDPAMLRYLDTANNDKDKPNENYARELLELFTLGEGHYTEIDVREAARAFTGWTISEGRFRANANKHDFGKKKFLGEEGYFDGEDIIDILLRRNPTSRHLTTKLLEYFMQDHPPQKLIDALELKLRQNRFDVRETLRALFMSEAFYREEAMFGLVKSPVELIVSMVRLLEIEPKDVHSMGLAADLMGQALFQPPNVKGWDGGLDWINTATLFTRYTFAARLLDGLQGTDKTRQHEMGVARLSDAVSALMHDLDEVGGLKLPKRCISSSPQPPFDPAAILASYGISEANEAVDHFVRRLLQKPIDPALGDELKRVLETHPGSETLDPKRVVKMVVAILCTPEFQLY